MLSVENTNINAILLLRNLRVDIDKLLIAADQPQSHQIRVSPVTDNCSLGLVLFTSMTVEVQFRASFCINILIITL